MNGYLSKLLLVTLFLIGCSTNKKLTCTLQPNEVAFIESCTTIEGKPIEGIAPEGRRIGGQPIYKYSSLDSSIGIVNSNIDIDISNVIAILGNKLVQLGTIGSGMSSEIIGIEKIPFNYKEIEIHHITANHISFNIKGKEIKLKVGDSWESQSTKIDTLEFNSSRCVIETISTHKITFHGTVNRAKIIIN